MNNIHNTTFGPVKAKTRSVGSRVRLKIERESPTGRNPIDESCSTYCCFKLHNISKVLMDKKFCSAKSLPALSEIFRASCQAYC